MVNWPERKSFARQEITRPEKKALELEELVSSMNRFIIKLRTQTYTLLIRTHMKVVVVVMNAYNKNRRPTPTAFSRLGLTKFRRGEVCNWDVLFTKLRDEDVMSISIRVGDFVKKSLKSHRLIERKYDFKSRCCREADRNI